jgi:hypothetical protein
MCLQIQRRNKNGHFRSRGGSWILNLNIKHLFITIHHPWKNAVLLSGLDKEPILLEIRKKKVILGNTIYHHNFKTKTQRVFPLGQAETKPNFRII